MNDQQLTTEIISRKVEHNNKSVLKHYEIYANEISEICRPFFNETGVTCFIYSRIFNDGSRIYLCSNGKWNKHYINAKFHENHQHTLSYLTDKNVAYALWEGFKTDQIYVDAYEHNIWNGFTLYEHTESNNEAYLFGTTRENYKMINFFLNNVPELKNFINYFKDKASNIILPSNKNTLTIPSCYQNKTSYTHDLIAEYKKNKYGQITKGVIGNTKTSSPLSCRESQCLYWAAKGKTSEETAKILKISSHTVVEYLLSAAKKLNSKNKTMSVARAISNGFLQIDELI